MQPPYRIELLGTLRVRTNSGVPSHFRTQKTGALLAYLAFYHQRAHLRDELAELLWSEDDPEAARRSLSTALWALRRDLRAPGEVTPVGADRQRIWLEPD